jgi:tubulin monoglycylase TTLL3/8
LKRALKQRGWLHNTDSSSPFFDLKFTLQGREIDYGNLQDFQLVNHFEKNGVITTKIGLTKSLRNLMWIDDTSEDNFYPKCFDLND